MPRSLVFKRTVNTAPRIDRILAQTVADLHRGGATNYIVQTVAGVYYIIYIDESLDVVFIKSTDSGATWSAPTTIFTGTAIQLSVWYDRWSNISAGLIHIAYTETTGHDVLYRSIDTENSDTLGTQTTIFDGASAVAANGHLSICRARGGNLGCAFNIDAGAEEDFVTSADVGATWDAATSHAEGQTLDQVILMPGWNAGDTNDFMMFFWDQSAGEISRKLYDDSGDSWGETTISGAGTMTASAFSTDGPHWSAAVDIANSRNVLVAWSARDTANADLRLWTVTEAAITESATNVVLNSTDDQGFAALGIARDTGIWYVFYGGLSAGSETMNTSVQGYYKTTADAGATWSSETLFTQALRQRRMFFTIPRFTGSFMVAQSIISPAASSGTALLLVSQVPGVP